MLFLWFKVNGRSVENLSVNEVMKLVGEGGDMVVLNILKYTSTPQPSLVSSSASSNQIGMETSPEASSTSPNSTHTTTTWYTSSPESGKTNSLSLRTSGSQTDSLDSPHSSARMPGDGMSGRAHSEQEKPNLLDRAYKFISKPFHNDRDRNREREDRTSSREMDGSSKSYISPSPSNACSAEEEVIEELNKTINGCIKQSTPSMAARGTVNSLFQPKDPKRSSRREEPDNAGTWPKCRPHVGYLDNTVVSSQLPFEAPKKQRPSLTPNMNERSYTSSNSQSRSEAEMDSKVPPKPPERNDSFKRGASIKHSPQNSDTSKYSHGHVNNVSATSTPTPYLPSPTKQSSHLIKGRSDKQSPINNSSVQLTKYEKHQSSSMHYVINPKPDTTKYLDNTVVSAQDQDILQHFSQKWHQQRGRPLSAPSGRNRREQLDMAHLVHGSRDHGPNKPTSLDINPVYPLIYSPRPLPHSGQNITPSGGGTVSPRDHNSVPFHSHQMRASQSLPARSVSTLE